MMAHRDRSRNGTEIAAIPMRWSSDGTLFVLMVAARGSGRWVMPKGWRINGAIPWKFAEIQALDRAGAVGHVGINPIGRYRYDRIMPDGAAISCEVEMFPMLVERLRRDWKYRRTRRRRWFEVAVAAGHVEQAELAEFLRKLSCKPPQRTALGSLFSLFD
ncbi:NUDIX hydrolase [Rhodovulum tesquicola]|uniref:NUDIX hydrolase n=1 Tax=Rhodovulum tesquicola TaxID=540254 RepID=UPI0020977B44|nr:NUDIX hydrolase [Rhodovulum tesquicola]MCO8143831.1 NUDIX hydrolase [Rhodovulum tesquicola]